MITTNRAIGVRSALAAAVALALHAGPSHASSPAATVKAGQAVSKSGATFVPVPYSDLPGWHDDDHLAALKTFRASCSKVAAKPAKSKLQAGPALANACREAENLPAKVTRAEAKVFFERFFRPHRVNHGGPQGLVTGYYEPMLEGSRTPTARFKAPLHKRPADLVTLVDETQRAKVGSLTHARATRAGIVPFATRAEIDDGAISGQSLELVYLEDPVDVFFLQIQGSGRVRLTDGTTIRVHYDGKNGHPYTSIGRFLIDKGLLAAEKVSMSALGRWLKADPARGRMVMQQNASYVFFRELPDTAPGPLGVLETPLVAGRSLAVDAGIHTLGAPIYLSAPTLTHPLKGKPYNRLMIAQDVGSAIKGPERGDIYFGSGDAAGKTAGVTKHPAQYFALLAVLPGSDAIASPARPKPAAKQAQQ